MTACCDDGEAWCRPPDIVSESLVDRLYLCAGGDICVPADYLGSGYQPRMCKSIAGEAGACVSLCVKSVKQLESLLPTDVCEAGERCAPCIDPTDGQPSGACDAIACEEAATDPGPAPDPGAPNEPVDLCDDPPSVIDPSGLPPCCPGAHCVPGAIVPQGQQSLLDKCDDGSFCVPDKLISSGGFYTPPTCTSVGGSEGRCMSTCVPAVAEEAKDLPQDICEAGEKCTLCCDPFTGESTGACTTSSCDIGPAVGCGVPIFPPCCSDSSGHCVDPALVPAEKHGNLEGCGNGLLCVPDVMQDLSYKGSPCTGSILFVGDYFGVCLPKCLKLPLEFALSTNGCPSNYVCAPCKDPFFNAPTGAPGCG